MRVLPLIVELCHSKTISTGGQVPQLNVGFSLIPGKVAETTKVANSEQFVGNWTTD